MKGDMPFTPCHAAAALPIRRLVPFLPMAPLMAGTVAPDFEYILRLGFNGGASHTVAGLFLFCLPAGLLAWALFEWWIRPGLSHLLPAAAVGGIPRRAGLGAAAAAVLVGAVSHIAWDSFTHPAGWSVVRWPVLATEAFPGSAWYRLLQHGSSLVGGIVLLVRFREYGRGPWPAGSMPRWILIVGLVLIGGLLNAGRSPRDGVGPHLAYAAVGGMAAGALGLLLGARIRCRPRPGTPG